MSKIKIVSKKVIEISNTYCFEVYENNELIFESYYYDGQDFSENPQGWGEFIGEDLGLMDFKSEPYKIIYPYTLIDLNKNEHKINNQDELDDFYDLELRFYYKYPVKVAFIDGSIETINAHKEIDEYLKQKNSYVETIEGFPADQFEINEYFVDDIESAKRKIKSILK